MTGTQRPRRIRHVLTIIGALALAGPAAAFAQCDLAATFGGPGNPSFPTGQPASLSVRFTNLATTGACAANQVRLRRSGGGGGAAVVAPAPFQALPALAPQGVALLTFSIEASLPATYTYEVEYATPHENANSGNHHPTRTVTFTYPAATLALPDLAVTSVRPAAELRAGDCNTVDVTVRNTGGALAASTQLTLIVTGPQSGDATVDRKALMIGSFTAGETRTVPVTALRVPDSGAWRLEAAADATLSVTESNEQNNTSVLTTDVVSRRCAP